LVMKHFLLVSTLLFAPAAVYAAEFGALAAGVATDEDSGSAAAGVGFGDSSTMAARNAVENCADTTTKVQVTCRIVTTFQCGGTGYVTTGTGNRDDGRAIAAWGTGGSSLDAQAGTLQSLKEKGAIEWSIKAPIGGETDDCDTE
jgi:hypothetical protein